MDTLRFHVKISLTSEMGIINVWTTDQRIAIKDLGFGRKSESIISIFVVFFLLFNNLSSRDTQISLVDVDLI